MSNNDILAFDYHTMQQARQRYKDETGENPYGIVIDNVTVWDLVAATSAPIGGDLAEELFKYGFSERQIGDLQVLAVAGLDKQAVLVDRASFKEALLNVKYEKLCNLVKEMLSCHVDDVHPSMQDLRDYLGVDE